MYRRRAKLRDIMHVVDRHNTGAMPREKLHLCLELADLPVPDRTSEQQMYGKFMSREVFRYNDFLDAMKYDPAYRHLLTSRWRKLSPMDYLHAAQRQQAATKGGGSLTPEPTGAGLMLPPIAQASAGAGSRALSSSSNVGARRLRDAFRALDKGNKGTVTIEELQQGLVALDLVPTATNASLLELFRVCDRDGHGNINYNEFVRMLQEREAAGKPMFIPGYRGGGAMVSQSQHSRSRHARASNTTPGTLVSAMTQRLHTKYKMLKETLDAADREGRGTVSLDTLKNILVGLNVVDKAQLKTGELEEFFRQYTKGGMIDYGRFADSVKAQDLAQLAGLSHPRT